MTIECNDDAAKTIIEWVLGRKICEPFRGLIVKNGDAVTGAMIFNNYDQRDVHFTCTMTAPISLKDARFVVLYVFSQLGCTRCTAVTSEANVAAIRALTRLGFKFEGRLRKHFGELDGILYGLLKSEQKIVRGM